MKQKLKKQKGITLIALIITIIIILILATVSIKLLVDQGIIGRAQSATEQYTVAQEKELISLGYVNYQMEKMREENATLTVEGATVTPNGENSWLIIFEKTGNQYKLKDGTITEATGFNPEDITIGTPLNQDKYGWKVPGYTVTTEEFTTGVWRLFYQDSNYTYLITDELVGSYKPSDYYTDYENGADVTTVGQRLNPMISSMFTKTNTNTNIRATAWLTDPKVWSDYAKGDAVFAIGSPTAELFAASYNNTGKANTIMLEKGTYGYKENAVGDLLKKEDNHGIYNKDGLSNWWLASPDYGFDYYGMFVYGYVINNFVGGSVDDLAFGVRPVVCIPTSVFNMEYLSNLEND